MYLSRPGRHAWWQLVLIQHLTIAFQLTESPDMTDQPTLIDSVAQAFRDHGLTTAITALMGGSLAIAANVTRKALTNEAMLERLEHELAAERERIDKQRAEDRHADADRLERIETDIRAMRDLMFEAFQRARTD